MFGVSLLAGPGGRDVPVTAAVTKTRILVSLNIRFTVNLVNRLRAGLGRGDRNRKVPVAARFCRQPGT
jgi:hypothetical protein